VTEQRVIADSALVERYAQQAMATPVKKVETKAPADLTVNLPGGYITQEGLLVKTATVRELNGSDEESISKVGTAGKALALILQRGLELVGDEPVTKDILDTLLSGDRDAILLGIRKATFGKDVTFTVPCTKCNVSFETVVDLDKDVPIRELNESDDRVWEMEVKAGTITVALPNGLVQRKLLETNEKTMSELSTILLAGCVTSLNGAPSVGTGTVLQLGMMDREKINNEIAERNPGPRLLEVSKACEVCGETVNLPLSLAALFRI
jgi:hypothetical protein